jgi:hypothetical protein
MPLITLLPPLFLHDAIPAEVETFHGAEERASVVILAISIVTLLPAFTNAIAARGSRMFAASCARLSAGKNAILILRAESSIRTKMLHGITRPKIADCLLRRAVRNPGRARACFLSRANAAGSEISRITFFVIRGACFAITAC